MQFVHPWFTPGDETGERQINPQYNSTAGFTYTRPPFSTVGVIRAGNASCAFEPRKIKEGHMFIPFTPLKDLSLLGLLRKKRLLTVEHNLVIREERRIADLRNKLAIDGVETES